MAFYVLVQRILCYRIRGYKDMIAWYKKYLHKKWLDSLSEEERNSYLWSEKQRATCALQCLGIMSAFTYAYGKYEL